MRRIILEAIVWLVVVCVLVLTGAKLGAHETRKYYEAHPYYEPCRPLIHPIISV